MGEHSSLNSSEKKFVIESEGNASDAYYIQSAALNRKPLNKFWFYRDELFKGGTLKLVMGSNPNKKRGIGNEQIILLLFFFEKISKNRNDEKRLHTWYYYRLNCYFTWIW
ncbi:MAG: glycoside hydrolase domain-containing protein [Proteiniphilum sp.]